MKTLLLFLCIFFIEETCYSINVTIIESQSYNAGHNMDDAWNILLNGMGYTSSINPQTTLDDTTFFATTDILIIASGVIYLPPNRITTIQQFLLRGGKIYFQTEYDPTYTTNQGFAQIVNSLGGNFNWNGTTPGTLAPMNELGSLSNTPNTAAPLSDFWYGSPGLGCSGIEPFLEYNGLYYGFIFCSPVSAGRMITTSDQDWIRTATPNDSLLMKNIIYNLVQPAYTCVDSASLPIVTVSMDTLYSSAALSYQWYNSAGALAGDTNQDFVATISGYYHVCVTNSSGCTACSDSVLVRISQTGITNPDAPGSFQIFPNPAHTQFTISLNKESGIRNWELGIYDVMGREVYEQGFDKFSHHPVIEALEVNVNCQLNAGVYFVRVGDGDRTIVEKLVIE